MRETGSGHDEPFEDQWNILCRKPLAVRYSSKEWGFDGLVMTDWFGLDDRVKSAEAGLDLEMPGTDGKALLIWWSSGNRADWTNT